MRKGSFDLIPWIGRFILLGVAMVLIVMMVRFFTERPIDAQDVQTTAVLSRLYYDADVWAYEDSVGRSYPGVFDLEKYKTADIDALFDSKRYGETFTDIAARFTVRSPSGCMMPLEPLYLHETTFNRYYALAERGVKGGQSATLFNTTWPISFRTGERSCPATIDIIVVRPNS